MRETSRDLRSWNTESLVILDHSIDSLIAWAGIVDTLVGVALFCLVCLPQFKFTSHVHFLNYFLPTVDPGLHSFMIIYFNVDTDSACARFYTHF